MNIEALLDEMPGTTTYVRTQRGNILVELRGMPVSTELCEFFWGAVMDRGVRLGALFFLLPNLVTQMINHIGGPEQCSMKAGRRAVEVWSCLGDTPLLEAATRGEHFWQHHRPVIADRLALSEGEANSLAAAGISGNIMLVSPAEPHRGSADVPDQPRSSTHGMHPYM